MRKRCVICKKMWQIISPNSSSNAEPIELKKLKFQLANNECTCKFCVEHEKSMVTSNLQRSVDHGKTMVTSTTQKNKKTQINYSQASLVSITNKLPSGLLCCGLPENIFCPGCYMALNLFQNKDTRILKDEESETNSNIFSSDKSTEKSVTFLEKATCMTDAHIPKYSNVTFCDAMTEYSNDISLNPMPSTKPRNQVSFIDTEKDNRNKPSYYGNCLCMENFIDTIRPPLLDI